ncbi:MAG TPA: carboxypeptidase-like regulatory domain-containing protein [Pyrinomonadaceae bacterium]|nr:carboxypeptidase-like regulatory domain-containing protein [Pyrinomonadaceae bacterium]
MRKTLRFGLALFALAILCEAGAQPQALASGRAATVSGSVRDNKGNPIAGAVVSLIREGSDEIIKEVKSLADGSFLARIAPGRYTLRAIADGFSAVLFDSVQVRPADDVVYRFNLEPVGSGRTAPERRKDRDESKWILRSRSGNRSIFQAGEERDETIDAVLAARQAADDSGNASLDDAITRRAGADDETTGRARTQGVVETYVASSAGANGYSFVGLNFAAARPLSERVDLIVGGQTGAGRGAPQRLETTTSIRATNEHLIKLSAAGGVVSNYAPSKGAGAAELGQLSLRAVDEWVVRDGVVIVLGLDYSRFLGASRASSLSPRFGLKFDANPHTRLSAAYTPAGDWSSAAQSVEEFEDGQVAFHQPASTPVALVDGRAVMERSRRLEFGVERVLDNESSIEASAFFDTTSNHGVGLFAAPLSAFAGEAGLPLMKIANQEGAARGLRVVYTRRISHILSASAGYSFGRGQQLSARGAIASPSELFSNGSFQAAAVEMNADLDTGTRVRTVFRFSPRATVFAIDPFAGRLAVYDPSLSILITQELPTFGLPVRAQAVIDARNLLDAQTCTEDGETFISVDAARRSLRGGISVRF